MADARCPSPWDPPSRRARLAEKTGGGSVTHTLTQVRPLASHLLGSEPLASCMSVFVREKQSQELKDTHPLVSPRLPVPYLFRVCSVSQRSWT